ncbi:GON-4-like protein isoform 2-T2 [Pholidichthys leucotaenia]
MAADTSVPSSGRRRPPEDDVCPLQVKYVRTDGGTDRKSQRASACRTGSAVEDRTAGSGDEAVAMETSDDDLGQLDVDLDRKSKRLNLTSNNVRAILHEVITHERVVAMMKAAIRDTQDLPMFEPKMTRSRLKQAVQQGQPLSWSLSALNTVKPPQFVDIDLEEDEDSSDEEYCPNEDEEEDTAEESFLSDGDSLASPPRMHLGSRPPVEGRNAREPPQKEEVMTSPGSLQPLPPVPAEPSFLERLNAVEEELDSSSAFTYNQSLDSKPSDGCGGTDEGAGCLAFRTRSKRPLVDIPLGQLEAELLAPDITADMYDQSAAQREEDHHWTAWLRGLMVPECEDEAEDEDDPEYNFLEDLDEPDLEDYRTDRAVQITKKEVNELLEELFETLQEEVVAEEEEAGPKFNVPQALRFEAPLANMLTERRQTVRKQLEAVQQRRALQDSTNQLCHVGLKDVPASPAQPGTTVVVVPSKNSPALHLDHTQKLQLQQQIQQHVQLLTQVHLLSRCIDALKHQASITRTYLEELQTFSCRQEELRRSPSSFRVCNLQGALDLLQEVEHRGKAASSASAPPGDSSRRFLPRMSPATNSSAFPLMPADAAWLFATRPVFLYPELLPVCSLDPAFHSRNPRKVYTPGENGLLVLALKHFSGTVQSEELISSYLLCKKRWNIKKHIKDMRSPKAPPNIVKTFLTQGMVPPLPLACSRVHLDDQHPPVDRDISNMPNWLKNSQDSIRRTRLESSRYPACLPPTCSLRLHPNYMIKCRSRQSSERRLFTLAHNASLPPLAKAQQQERLPPPVCTAVPLAVPVSDIIQPCVHIGPNSQPIPLPLATSPTMPCTKPGYFLLQMVWTPPEVNAQLQPVGDDDEEHGVESRPSPEQPIGEEESPSSASTLSPLSEREEQQREEENQMKNWIIGYNGGENTNKEDGEPGEGGGGGDEDTGGEGEQGGDDEEEEEEEREDGGGGGDGDEDGDKDKDEDQEEEEEEDFDDLTQDEDEEEVMSSASEESVLSVPELQETMKQLTWLAAERRLCGDGDSEEDHSPTSPGSQEEEEEEEEEVPKEEEEEESGEGRGDKVVLDEETPTGEEGTPRGGRRGPGRGRGRSRPRRGLRSRQERHSKDAAKLLLLYDENILENDPHRASKDVAFAQSYLSRVREALQDSPALLQDFVSLLNEFEQVGDGQGVVQLFRRLRCILGNHTDLLRDFAAFLHPEQALLCGLWEEQQAFERSRRFLRQLEISFGDNPSHYQKIIKALQTGPDLSPSTVHELKSQMALLLKGHTHLQAEFWVFFDDLRPPPARPGQFEEAHWPEDGGGGGADGGAGTGQASGGATDDGGFEEVRLPEEEEEGQKMQPMTSRRQRRKMDTHGSFKGCDWPDKDCPCLCHDAKIRKHRRKGCSRCHSNKISGGVSSAVKSLDPIYSQIGSAHSDPPDEGVKEGRQQQEEARDDDGADKEEERQRTEKEQGSAVKRSRVEAAREPESLSITSSSSTSVTSTTSSVTASIPIASSSTSVASSVPPSTSSTAPGTSPSPTSPPFTSSATSTITAGATSTAPQPTPPPPPDLPVCAQNISLTASGEKVILWTREADRVILKTCQQDGANQSTFEAISSCLGNKTPSEVSQRFLDLMHLFRTAARQTISEEEAPPTETKATNEAED